jgi:uncharacterized protein (TIGR03067 family)
MNTIAKCTVLLAWSLLGFAGTAPAQGDKKGLAELQGTWKLLKVVGDEEPREIDDLARWVIQENKVLYGGSELAELTVDATTTPPSIDLNFRHLGLRKRQALMEGIYAVDKDTLKICVNRETDGVKDRPLDFTTQDKPNRRLLVFQRTPPGEAENVAGFIGIAISLNADRNEVGIGMVFPDSPAQKAGLKKDDVLLQVGGGKATDLKTVIALIRQVRPGAEVTIRVRRDGKEQDITVRVGVLPFYVLD